jgi:hypothetical protein
VHAGNAQIPIACIMILPHNIRTHAAILKSQCPSPMCYKQPPLDRFIFSNVLRKALPTMHVRIQQLPQYMYYIKPLSRLLSEEMDIRTQLCMHAFLASTFLFAPAHTLSGTSLCPSYLDVR